MVPRPLGHTIRASHPGQVLHMDFIFIAPLPADESHSYSQILVLCDNFSSYTELVPCSDTSADHVVQAILWWISRLTVPKVFVTDRGSHFTARVLDQLRGMLGVDHRHAISYASWTNGKVEKRCKDALRALRVLCSESRLPPQSWPSFLPLAQFILNHTPSPRLDNLAPVTVMCGLPPSSPLLALWQPNLRELRDISSHSPSVREHVDLLLDALVGYHRRVSEVAQRPASSRPASAIDFAPGDWVLYSHVGPSRRPKVLPTWHGPARVLEAVDDSNSAFVIFDVPAQRRYTFHAAHLKRYADSELTVTPQLEAFAAHCGTGFVLEAIVDHRLAPSPQLLCRWEGYTDPTDDTWESFPQVFEDAAALVRRYVRHIQDPVVRERLEALMR